MDITPIITVAELQDLTMNEDLLKYCSEHSEEALKMIKQVSLRVFSKIDKEIFYVEDENTYEFPEDLKLAVSSLCESYYTFWVVDKNNNATKKVVSERIDDYSYTYSDSQYAYTFFGIPTDSNVIAVIEAYSWLIGKWYRTIHLH